MQGGEIQIVKKPWGYEEIIHNSDLYCGKKLVIWNAHQTSLHLHLIKIETLYLQSGRLVLEYFDENENIAYTMAPGQAFHVPSGTVHRLIAYGDVELFEFSTKHNEADTIRLDKGGKIDESY